jgi:hypothetical protein
MGCAYFLVPRVPPPHRNHHVNHRLLHCQLLLSCLVRHVMTSPLRQHSSVRYTGPTPLCTLPLASWLRLGDVNRLSGVRQVGYRSRVGTALRQ